MPKTRSKRSSSDGGEHARAMRGLEQLIAEGDRKWLEAEAAANPLLLVTLCELSDQNARFAAEPWRPRPSEKALWAIWLRCNATAIKSHAVRDQKVVKAMQRLCERAPTPSVARYIYSSAHARELLAWLEKQRRTDARDSILRPLRRAVTRKHALSILFDTV